MKTLFLPSSPFSSASTPQLATIASLLSALARLLLIVWWAQRSMSVRWARLLSGIFSTDITPKQGIAFVHAPLALFVALLELELPVLFHLGVGLWIAYAAHPLISLCKNIIRE